MFVHLPVDGALLNLGRVVEIRPVLSDESSDTTISIAFAGDPIPRTLRGPDAAAVLAVVDPLKRFRRPPGPSTDTAKTT